MKVPPKRKGNPARDRGNTYSIALNESPSEKEGKWGNVAIAASSNISLNESPSEKEGKFPAQGAHVRIVAVPSMKVPPKRKGNRTT